MDVTAVVLSAKPVTLEIPGVTVLSHVSTFSDAAGLLAARFAAMHKVRTPHFFFLDDDDELPADYERVIGLCLAKRTALAYTNELVRRVGEPERVRASTHYKHDDWRKSITVVHHLALCEAEAAMRVMRRMPRGTYGFEPLFYPELAKDGAAWVDEVGYIWNIGARGFSRKPDLVHGMARSAAYVFRGCHGND